MDLVQQYWQRKGVPPLFLRLPYDMIVSLNDEQRDIYHRSLYKEIEYWNGKEVAELMKESQLSHDATD